jgi:2'-5' RNA ligase
VDDPDLDELAETADWRRPGGLFVLAPITGAAGARVAAVRRQYDPKLAAANDPHVTLAGSSGVGPIVPGTEADTIRKALAPVAAATPPLTLSFGRPYRFMQTNTVSLPLDPHGPLRELHDKIARSGLSFGPARFTFTPHVTLSLYPALTVEATRALLATRVPDPVVIDRLLISQTDDPHPPRAWFELLLAADR